MTAIEGVSETFDPDAWDDVPGFEDLTDLTYHRARKSSGAHGTVRLAFDRPDVLNAFRPHTVDELLRVLEHARTASDVGVGLLEPGVLPAGDGQVAHHVQRVAAAGRPPGHHGDDDLGHGADEPLHLEDVQPAALRPDPRLVHRVGGLAGGVLVSRPPADPLVSAGAERPAPVLGAGSVPGEQDDSHVGGHPGVVQGAVELVDGVRPERVAHLGPVEGDPHAAQVPGPVVGDVGEPETRDLLPRRGVEDLGHLGTVLLPVRALRLRHEARIGRAGSG